jgi:hypothetical protein
MQASDVEDTRSGENEFGSRDQMLQVIMMKTMYYWLKWAASCSTLCLCLKRVNEIVC